MLKQLDIFYHVTTPLSEPEIEKEISKAQSLQERVLNFFKSHKNQEFIWSEVAEKMGLEVGQYGSVKRCISHLVRDKQIEKLETMQRSVFGGMSHKHVYRK